MAPRKSPNLKLIIPDECTPILPVSEKEHHFNFPKEYNETEEKPHRYLYLAAVSCLLSGVSAGFANAYSAPAGPKMKLHSSRLRLNEEEVTWVGSILTLGALFGGLAGGPLSDKFGRKSSLFYSGILCVLGWLLIAYGDTISFLLVGRVICGFHLGFSCVVAPQYLVEISTVDVRGFIGSFFETSLCIGCLLVVVIGSGRDIGWSWLAIISSAPVILTMASMMCIPESPRWLIQKGRLDEAVRASIFLHGNLDETEDELIEAAEQTNSKRRRKEDGEFQFILLKKREYYLPYIFAMALMFFQQFCGSNAITFYTVEIFHRAKVHVNPNVSAIIINGICLVSAFTGGMLIDKIGRRVLLLISCAGQFVGLVVMGLYCYWQHNLGASFVHQYGWLGIVALSVVSAFYEIGLGPVPWMIIPEIVPQRARGFAGSSAIALNWGSAFIVTKTFHWMVKGIGADGTYWFYAAMSLLGFVFTWICIPETKGMTFASINRHFSQAEEDLGIPDVGLYKEISPPFLSVQKE